MTLNSSGYNDTDQLHKLTEDDSESTLGDFFALTKPGVILLVVFTACIGLMLPTLKFNYILGFGIILSIALSAAGAAVFNMWYDRDIDLIMKRTQPRPIPAGRIEPQNALAFSIILCSTGLMIMYFSAPHVLCYLVFSIIFYTVIYTVLLKRYTDQNIVIGGAAGAFPPLIAWIAVSHQLTVEPLILFWLIFIWTPSHFWALAIFRCEDYRTASIPMLPLTKGVSATARAILLYTIALILSSYLPLFISLGHLFYGVGVTLINCPYLFYAWKLYRMPHPRDAIRLFSYSIFYLFILFFILLIDKLLKYF